MNDSNGNGFRGPLTPGDFTCEPGSVGVTTGGSNAYPTVVARIRERGIRGLDVLDMCCGVGTLGLMTLSNAWEYINSLTLVDINPANVRSASRMVAKYGITNTLVVHSNGFENLDPPEAFKFDLIISNPPHYEADDPTRFSGDPGWEFHHNFFAKVPYYLRPGGEAWLIETEDGGAHRLAKTCLDPLYIDIVSWEREPNDPPFFWLTLALKEVPRG